MRARTLLIAWVLAAQIIAPSLALASTARAGCCCSHAGEKQCHCPACSRVRAASEGQGVVGGCADAGGSAVPASTLVAAPAFRTLAPAPPPPLLPQLLLAGPPLITPAEVPTPPPLPLT